MKISELSGKVDTLIGLATDYKRTAESATAQAAEVPEDDPEVEALAHRIDDAIAVLTGTKTVQPEMPQVIHPDPNAPA